MTELSQPSVPDLLVALDRSRVIASLWNDERNLLLTAVSDLIHLQERVVSGADQGVVEAMQLSTPAIREVRGRALAHTAALAQLNLKLVPSE